MGVNLRSVFLMSRAVVPHLLARSERGREGRGVIINNSSVQGLQSQRGVPAYAATKGAVNSLTQNMVSPSRPLTPMYRFVCCLCLYACL